MPLATSTLAYTDCYEALDRALADPKGARVHCATPEGARRLCARVHYARVLTREDNAKIYPEPDHPLHGRSVYDGLVCKIIEQENRWFVYIMQITPITHRIESLSELPDEPEPEVEPEPEPEVVPIRTGVRRI